MISVAGALIAVLAAAFFSLAELAIISVSRLRLRHWVRQTMHDSGWLAADAVDQPYRLLQPILVGHTLAVTAAAMCIAAALAADGRWAEAPLTMAGWTALVLVPPLYLIGEIIPRAIAGARAHQIFAPVVMILRGCSWLFRPVIGVADRLTRLALRWLGGVAERPAAFGRRSLESLLVESERVGLVEAEERRIIAGVFAFGQTPVAAVMTPLERMATAPAAATAGEMAALIRETGYSRIPLHGVGPHEILGMVHVFDLFSLDPAARPRPRPVIAIGPATLCDALLIDMKRRRCHLAIVVEGGRAQGMVTMEDLVEELVGEIRDEHDEAPPQPAADSVDGAETAADIPPQSPANEG